MKVAIIGAGRIGSALTRAFSSAGHELTISSRTRAKAESVASETGARVASSNRDAVEASDIVVLAVPYPELDSVVRELSDTVEGKVVVETTNRFDPSDPASYVDGSSAAEQLHAHAPKARVVKAFNTMFASQINEPTVDGVEVDGFFAGDDEAAKGQVAELVQAVGLRPVDAGSLGMARVLEGMANLIISLNIRDGLPRQNGWKLIGPTKAASTRAA